MYPSDIEKTLAEIEVIFDSVSKAIGSGEPDTLLREAENLRSATIDISRLLNQADFAAAHADDFFKLRVKSLSEGLAIQRENLIKRSVPVSQALGILVPGSRASTYQPFLTDYGNVHPQSGEFKPIRA